MMACLNCGIYDAPHKCIQCGIACFCSRECQLARLKNHGCKPTKRYLDFVNEVQWRIYERYRFEQDFNGRTRVLRKERLVYKFCKTEQEYLETLIFYERHQEYKDSIVPVVMATVDNAWLIVTEFIDGLQLLSGAVRGTAPNCTKEPLQYALVKALSKFKSNSFGLDIVGNLNNIGYNPETGRIVFYENNGKVHRYQRKEEMIFQFLHQLQFREPRLLGTIWNEETIKKYLE